MCLWLVRSSVSPQSPLLFCLADFCLESLSAPHCCFIFTQTGSQCKTIQPAKAAQLWQLSAAHQACYTALRDNRIQQHFHPGSHMRFVKMRFMHFSDPCWPGCSLFTGQLQTCLLKKVPDSCNFLQATVLLCVCVCACVHSTRLYGQLYGVISCLSSH